MRLSLNTLLRVGRNLVLLVVSQVLFSRAILIFVQCRPFRLDASVTKFRPVLLPIGQRLLERRGGASEAKRFALHIGATIRIEG